MRVFAISIVFTVIFVSTVTFAYAHHGSVLGEATTSTRIDAQIAQGPGFLKPSSPLYFLDEWHKNILLLLNTFNPQAQAKIHLQVAGERLAEVKDMVDNKQIDPHGLDVALRSLEAHITGAKTSLKADKSKGNNVEKLAEDLSDTLDLQHKALTAIKNGSDQATKLRLQSVEAAVKNDTIEIEDELPDGILQKKIEQELTERISDAAKEARDRAENALALAGELESEASKAGELKLSKLQKAVLEAAREERKKAEDLFKEEQKKQQELIKAQQDLQKAAADAAKKAADTAKAAEKVNEVKQTGNKSGSTTSGSSNSGSGSSGGSNSSGSSNSGGSSTSGSSGGGDSHGGSSSSGGGSNSGGGSSGSSDDSKKGK